jgi:hypothetical protein
MLTLWRHASPELDSSRAVSDLGRAGTTYNVARKSPHARDAMAEMDVPEMDVYFVVQIESVAKAGYTLAPSPSLAQEAGVAIADQTVDGPLVGQEPVRTLAHEITHYLLNRWNGDDDHRTSFQNLMYPVTDDV